MKDHKTTPVINSSSLPSESAERSNEKRWVKVLDAEQIRRVVVRIAHEILEKNRGAQKLAVVGIRTRGEYMAQRVVNQINTIENAEVPLGVVDISLYRDDIAHDAEHPLIRGTELPFNVDKYHIVLVDDVLFTGRTIRAALDAIIDFGRPRSVQLAVLCDRGHRELPIRADYVGRSLPTSRDQTVKVLLKECDEEDSVFLSLRPEKKA